MTLEDIIYASVEIRNFLKLFSEQQWNKVVKGVLLLGIHRLEELMERCGNKGVHHLSLDELNEIVIAGARKLKKRRRQAGKNCSDSHRYDQK